LGGWEGHLRREYIIFVKEGEGFDEASPAEVEEGKMRPTEFPSSGL